MARVRRVGQITSATAGVLRMLVDGVEVATIPFATTTPFSVDLGNLASGVHTITDEVVSGGPVTIESAAESAAASHTLRAESGAGSATTTLAPGADVPVTAGAGSLIAPLLSAAVPLAAKAGEGAFQAPAFSAVVPLPAMAGSGSFTPLEILVPYLGHRIRAVAGASQAETTLVPGADWNAAQAAGAVGAIALSAEVPLAAMTGAGAFATPSIGCGVPTISGAGAFAAPTFSGAPTLATMVGLGVFWAPSIVDGSAPVAPGLPYNPALGMRRRPPWLRRHLGRMFW